MFFIGYTCTDSGRFNRFAFLRYFGLYKFIGIYLNSYKFISEFDDFKFRSIFFTLNLWAKDRD